MMHREWGRAVGIVALGLGAVYLLSRLPGLPPIFARASRKGTGAGPGQIPSQNVGILAALAAGFAGVAKTLERSAQANRRGASPASMKGGGFPSSAGGLPENPSGQRAGRATVTQPDNAPPSDVNDGTVVDTPAGKLVTTPAGVIFYPNDGGPPSFSPNPDPTDEMVETPAGTLVYTESGTIFYPADGSEPSFTPSAPEEGQISQDGSVDTTDVVTEFQAEGNFGGGEGPY